VASWLDDGLPGRSERTKSIYKDGLAPLLAKIGHRPLRDLTALEVRKGRQGLSGQLSTRSLQIGRNALERALRFAQVHERVGRNVAELIEAPKGRAGRPSKSLSLAQARELLKAAEGSRWYGYIVLLLLSGLRTEEVRALRWDHVLTWVDDATVWPHAWVANCASLEFMQGAGLTKFAPARPQRWVIASFEHLCGPHGVQHPHVHNIVIPA